MLFVVGISLFLVLILVGWIIIRLAMKDRNDANGWNCNNGGWIG